MTVADHAEQRRRLEWKWTVARGGCVMCRAHPVDRVTRQLRAPDIARIEGHHIIAKRLLRRIGRTDLYWDQRNGIGLCSYHHHRHEWRIEPVPFVLLPDAALEFAAELDLLFQIEHDYPGVEDLR